MLFRVAAGPRLGFGHLVRAARVARALGVRHAPVSLRATHPSDVRRVARSLGLVPVTSSVRGALDRLRPTVLIVDDPRGDAGREAVSAARRRGILSVSFHDLGLGPAGADVAFDGSVAPGTRLGIVRTFSGPAFAVLDPRCASAHRESRHGVVVALGGGPRRAIALALAAAIAQRTQGDVHVAVGFMAGAGVSPSPRVHIVGPTPLAILLRRCRVAVTAGGLTALEGAACATPCLVVSVVDAQRPTAAGLARAGVALDGGRLSARRVTALADAVAALLAAPRRRQGMAARARRLVDGGGAERVAAEIRRLLASPPGQGVIVAHTSNYRGPNA